jgi:curved DNA-binding protein
MDFKDYYATLGVAHDATHDQIRRAYRKLARKYHPDVSKLPNTEARFKEAAEAHEALIDPERRAAYDQACLRHERGQAFEAPAGRGPAGEADLGDFFESIFGHAARGAGPRRSRPQRAFVMQGEDQHARIDIGLMDSYRGATLKLALELPAVQADGRIGTQQRQLEVTLPKGVRAGQQLRLAGQGAAGHGGGAAGDLYLEVQFQPHPLYRVDGRDVTMDLRLAPWEAAGGASIPAPTPDGEVHLTVPAGAVAGQKLRLKGRGLPGTPAGDLYAVLGIALPVARSETERAAYAAFAAAFPGFDARAAPSA